MHDALDATFSKLADDRLPIGAGLEAAVAERVDMRRLNLSTYRASALAAAGAMLMGVGAGLTPALSAAHAESLEPLSALSLAPSTLLGGVR